MPSAALKWSKARVSGPTGALGGYPPPLLAQVAEPIAVPVVQQDTLLACVKAGLAEEVHGLVCALLRVGWRPQLVDEIVPSRPSPTLISVPLVLGLLQSPYLVAQDLNRLILVDDSGKHLTELRLRLDHLVNEVDLDRGGFQLITLSKECAAKVLAPGDGHDLRE